jgi:hypothetical protein
VRASVSYVAGTFADNTLTAVDYVLASKYLTNGYASATYSSPGAAGTLSSEVSPDSNTWYVAYVTGDPVYWRLRTSFIFFDAIISGISVSSWMLPSVIGTSNDFSGQTLHVDTPTTARNPTTKTYVDAALATVSPANWANYEAAANVRLGGKTLTWDTYSISSNGTLAAVSYTIASSQQWFRIQRAGSDMFRISSSNNFLAITNWTVNTTNIILQVATNDLDSSPWPECTTNLMESYWTPISTYTAVTNGDLSVALTFTNAWTNSSAAFFRAICFSTNASRTEILTTITTAKALSVDSLTVNGTNVWLRGEAVAASNISGEVSLANLPNAVKYTNGWSTTYSDGSTNKVDLALGANGQYLRSAGPSTAPYWAELTVSITNLPPGSLISTNTGSPGQFFMYDEGTFTGVITGHFASATGTGDFLSDGTIPMSSPLNFGGNKGTNMANGVIATDAATLGQVIAATQTLVTAAITNGLDSVTARETAITTATQNLVTATITNGLDTVTARAAAVAAATQTIAVASLSGTVPYSTSAGTAATSTNSLQLGGIVANLYATNAGTAAGGYYVMTNGVWTQLPASATTGIGADMVSNIVGAIGATQTVYNALRLGGTLAASYVTNAQANVSLSNATATGTFTLGGVARSTWPTSVQTGTQTVTLAFGPSAQWTDIAMSTNGQWIGAVAKGLNVYTTEDAGTNFIARDPNWPNQTLYGSIAASEDGQNVIVGAWPTPAYGQRSTDRGVTWSSISASYLASGDAYAGAGDSNLTRVIWEAGDLMRSVNNGVTWTAVDAVYRLASKIAASSSGKYFGLAMSDPRNVYSSSTTGSIWMSVNYGTNWTARATTKTWTGISCDRSGKYWVACAWSNYVYNSADYGSNWTARIDNRCWYGVAMAKEGGRCYAVASNWYVYTSADYGTNWTAITELGVKPWRCIATDERGYTAVAGAFGNQLVRFQYNAVIDGRVPYAESSGLATLALNSEKLGGLLPSAYLTNGMNVSFGTINGTAVAENGTNILGAITTATQNLVTASVTNGLAPVSYVNAATSTLVTASITNGLATVVYVDAATSTLAAVSLCFTNGGATIDGQPITNGAAITTTTSGGAVTSVFGRAGIVVAAAGDYTAGQVGAMTGAAVTSLVNSATQGLAAVAHTGAYSDLSGTPSIPSTNGLDTVSAREQAIAASTQTIAGASVSGTVPSAGTAAVATGLVDNASITIADATVSNQPVSYSQWQQSLAGDFVTFLTTNLLTGYTNSVTPTNLTFSALPTVPATAVSTSFTAVAGNYGIAWLATNRTFTQLNGGIADVELWLNENSAGSATVKPELYLYDTVLSNLVEFGENVASQTVAAGTVSTKQMFAVPYPAFVTNNACMLAVRIKCTSVSGSPTIIVGCGGTTPSHASISVPTAQLSVNYATSAGTAGTATNALQLGGIAADRYPTNLAAGVTDPCHDLYVTNATGAGCTVTVTRAMGEYIQIEAATNYTLCIDRPSYPANKATLLYVAVSNGPFSVTFCTNSISTNSATALYPGSSGVLTTNNNFVSLGFLNAPGDTNRTWCVRNL